MSTVSNELVEVLPYAAPMQTPEAGATIIQYDFLKELVQRIRDRRHDLAMRKLDNNGYAIELIVRNSMNQRHDVSMIGRCDTSELANKYVAVLHYLIKEYAK